jgi:hypothetical protein
MSSIPGGCHCGAVRVEFGTAREAVAFSPRACDCSFCCKHGAAWISDPEGRLTIVECEAGVMRDYRQGSQTARFLLCARCGVCVAVVFEESGRTWGAINAGCLAANPGFGASLPASPRTLGAADKVARWKALWIPDVVMTRASD